MRRLLSFGTLLAFAFALIPIGGAQASGTSTTTVIEAPNQFGVDAPMPLRIQVTNDAGAAAPSGSVTLQDGLGRPQITVGLTPTDNGGYSYALIGWATQQLGLNNFRAVYTPNTADFAASSSTFAGTYIFAETPLAVLRMPDRFVVGTQANLAVLINPADGGGSATFNVNNVQVQPSTPNLNGQVLFPWTPERSTQYTFVINYSNRDGNAARQITQPTFAFPSQ